MSKFSSQFVDTLTDLAFMLRKGTVLTENANRDLMWDKPGTRHYVLEVTENPDIVPVDVCAVVLGTAADLTAKTPAVMATNNRSWQHVTSAEPPRASCPHGHRIDTTPGATTSSLCADCHPKPALTRDEIQAIRQRELAATAPNRQATRHALHGRTRT